MRWMVTVLAALLLFVIANAAVLKREKRQADGCQIADLIFVMDSSGSIGIDNWKKQISFVKTVVESFEIGEKDVRVGITTFGNRATINFNLKDYFTKSEILTAIDQIPWKDQMTNTSGGIRTMYKLMFTPENGDRPDAPNLALVITDGESNRDADKTTEEANNARKENILMIALGIGDQVKQSELEGIADKKDLVFNADNFDALPVIRQQLVEAACEAAAACRSNADLLLILDASASIGQASFNAMKTAMQILINGTNILDDSSRVGLISFARDPKLEFDMGSFQTRVDVNDAIEQVNYITGVSGTNTASALELARSIYESERNRPNVKDVVVLFTDGGSDDFQRTIDSARLLRMTGVNILVVGVGTWLDHVELYEIASDPDDKNVFIGETPESLNKIAARLQKAVCDDVNECSSNPCLNNAECIEGINHYRCVCPTNFAGQKCQIPCSKPADVVIAMDASSSIGKDNFYEMQNFVKTLARTFNVNKDSHTRLGIETFGNDARVRFQLNTFATSNEVAGSISYMWQGGQTNTAGALNVMRTNMLQEQNGNRQGVRDVGILITDGRSNDRRLTFEESVKLHNAGINMMTIGIGVSHMYDIMELEGIASDPDSSTMFRTFNYTTLAGIGDQVVSAVCDEQDSCAGRPCGEGSQCIDKIGGYECVCTGKRTGKNCERGCDGIIDLVFMVDSSGSIRRHRFEMFKDYVMGVIAEMEIRPQRTRVGLLTFSDNVDVIFQLNTYTTKEDIMQAVKKIEYKPGRTNIADALVIARDRMFTVVNGDREDVPNFAVLLSDGDSTVNKERTLPEAISTRVSGIHLTVVATESRASSLELQGIASDPKTSNVYAVDQFSRLGELRQPLIGAICDDKNECDSNPCQNGAQCVNGLNQYLCLCPDRQTGAQCERTCTSRLDVAFILDASGSVEEKFNMQMKLAKLIVQGLNFNGERTRVGMVTFSDVPEVRFLLGTYSDKRSVLNAISFDLTRGRTNIADAFSLVRSDIFTSRNGDRVDSNVVILMSDAHSNVKPTETVPEARQLREQLNARLMVVGIGQDVNVDEMNSMASNPDNENTFFVETESELQNVANSILDQLCP